MVIPKENETVEEVRLPEWFRELTTQYRAKIAHQFILYGNVADLVPNPDKEDEPEQPYISLRQFLEKIFEERAMVLFYSLASIHFLKPSMEDEFRKAAGLDSDDTSSNPLAKAGVLQKRKIPQEPEALLPLLEKVLRTTIKRKYGDKEYEEGAVVINFAHHIAPNCGSGMPLSQNERKNVQTLIHWGQNEEIRNSGNIVLLVTDQIESISPELRQSNSEIKTILVPKPSKEERKEFLRSITEGSQEFQELQKTLKKLQSRLARLKSVDKCSQVKAEIQECEEKLQAFPNIFLVSEDFNVEEFTHATQGLGYRQIFEIFLRSRETREKIDLNYVKTKKKEILNNEFGDVMEVMEPERGLDDIGGLEHIKKRLLEIFEAIKAGELWRVPMGIDLYGPPGTGKTVLIEALAYIAGFNFIKAKNLRNMFVGGSEERMQKFKYGLYSLAPVVVNNDEADLGEAQRDAPKGDSGVSERQMKEWMDFRSDSRIRGKIIVISCSNRPDRIDPALKRTGRSDERWFVPMPSRDERIDIFKVMFKRYNVPTNITDFSPFADMTDGISGADIEKISRDSYDFARMQNKKEVDGDALVASIKDFIPSASQKEIDTMSLMALLESSSRRMLPPHIKEIITGIRKRNLVKNLDELIEQIRVRNIVDID